MPSENVAAGQIKNLRARLEENFAEAQALASFSARVQKSPILGQVLDDVYDIFKGIIPFDRLSLALTEENDAVARVLWVRSDIGPAVLKPGYSASIKKSSLQKVLDDHEPRIINDLEEYAKKNGASEATRFILKEGMKSNLTCPLYSGGTAFGFLFFASREKGAYDRIHVDTFVQIAAELSVVLEKSKLYNEIIELRNFKQHFMGIAAHDLSAPLSTCQNLVRLLRSGAAGPLNETQADALARIDKEQNGMLLLLRDILELSEFEFSPLEINRLDTNMETFLKEVVQSHQILARSKNINLECRIDGSLPFLSVDGPRLRQAMDNLISNAVKYSYEKSGIIVEGVWGEDELAIRVRDAGRGIPSGELNRLFKEFGTAHVSPTDGEKAAGLGLVIVKKIVDAHGGRIEVESEEGRGSTFSLILPARPSKKKGSGK